MPQLVQRCSNMKRVKLLTQKTVLTHSTIAFDGNTMHYVHNVALILAARIVLINAYKKSIILITQRKQPRFKGEFPFYTGKFRTTGAYDRIAIIVCTLCLRILLPFKVQEYSFRIM